MPLVILTPAGTCKSLLNIPKCMAGNFQAKDKNMGVFRQSFSTRGYRRETEPAKGTWLSPYIS